MAKRGRPSGIKSWWHNPNNIAAHYARGLMELWLAGAPVLETRVMLSSLAGRPEYQRRGLQLLAPLPRLRAECQQDIKIALNRVEQDAAVARASRVADSKKGKAGVRRYYAALRPHRG
jgi:hypothetical protein